MVYYTMPYVEGESLRTRLSREGELPIAEAIRLFREVADALAHAHRRGVVHRDIKPDNVLLSHGHAMVTDFGIAMALTDARGSESLTATGQAIGTPAYMAPEQVVGDGHIDQRADIYSLGVLGYEMLAGEPPFRGATAQALIGAQLARPPEPIDSVRPGVPVELALIVGRCLEKRPADRYQHAEEVMAALDAVVPHPTAGVRLGSGPVAPLRPLSLLGVLARFAAAGALVLGGAWVLRTVAGLPDWFFPAAVALLAVGLPVVLLAAAAHNRRVGRSGRPGVPGPLAARVTVRRAVWGGVGAFAGLGLVGAG